MSSVETMVTAAYTIGRFQPPTLGHVRMIRAMLAEAAGAPTFVFLSSAKDSLISSKLKQEFLTKMLTQGGVFPSTLTLVDTAECSPPCGGPLGGFGYLSARGLTGPSVLLYVGGDRLADFDPATAPMWSNVPEADRPTIKALPRTGEGAATYSSTDARKSLETPAFSKYLQDGTNQVSDADVERMRTTLRDALAATPSPAKRPRKGGVLLDESVLSSDLDGGVRRRAAGTRRRKRIRRTRRRL